MRWLLPILWLPLAAIMASLYGVINDQITVTLAPEYFSVFKRQEFGWLLFNWGLDASPTRVQAVAVGIAATWWFGILLGLFLAIAGTIGKAPLLSTRDFLRAVGVAMVVTAVFSIVFGAAAYILEPGIKPNAMQWPFLQGIRDVRAAVAVGWWHNGAYLGAVIGTVTACYLAGRWRARAT